MSEVTKNIVLIGIGNCGNQIAFHGEKTYPELVDCVYINTSEDDLSTVWTEGCLQFKIGDDEEIEGSGKNRDAMKEYLRADIKPILRNENFQNAIVDKRYGFILCSVAGGTGSGAGPVMHTLLTQMFPDTIWKVVPVLPGANASLMELGNTLEFLDELYNKLDNPSYMIYDNSTQAGLPDTVGLKKVNENIIEDIRVFSRIDNYSTPYESIDEADMDRIASTPGRTIVVKLDGNVLTQKNLEDNDLGKMLISAIKKSAHAETDRNKQVIRWGIITYLTEECNELYDSSLSTLTDFIGTPIERFNHNAINSGDESQNFIYLIAAGLSPINDAITKTQKRVKELQDALAKAEGNKCILDSSNPSYSELTKLLKENRRNSAPPKIDVDDVFSKF